MRRLVLGLCFIGLSACQAGEDEQFLDQRGLFYCVSDLDCDPGFFCDQQRQVCWQYDPPGLFTSYMDEDGDGYCVGENRLRCDKPEEDTDDTDKDIYPGAPDICDGKDNDSDANTADGQLSCGNAGDCPQSAAPTGAIFFCEGVMGEKRCVLKPAKTHLDAVCALEIPCVDGRLGKVPDVCL